MIRLWAIAFALSSVAIIPLVAHGATTSEAVEPALHTYKAIADAEALKLHVFMPTGETPADGRTVIVFFFGGGWVGGTPGQFYSQCQHLAAQGLVAISAEYRVNSRHKSTVGQSVADGKSAIRYLRAHAKEFGINPDKIISAGGSAGGHIAACTGTLEAYDEPGEDVAVSARPNAMILLNPVIDTTPGGYLGKLLPKEGDESLSPLHHVKPGTPPTLICHGTADKTVPYDNVVEFEKAMKEAGNRCELASFEGAGHGFFNPGRDGDHFDAVVTKMDAFIQSLEW